VEAGVSILQTAAQFIVNEKLRIVEDGFDSQIVGVRKSAKRWRKCNLVLCEILIMARLNRISLWYTGIPAKRTVFMAASSPVNRAGHAQSYVLKFPRISKCHDVPSTGLRKFHMIQSWFQRG